VAVILEIVHPNGVRTWQRLDALPLTIGRGLSNDLILDDPYVDPQHARIALDDAGTLQIEDLGSVNGLVMYEARARGALPLKLGSEVRVGRTTFRFRDSNEAVAPAIVDDHLGLVAPPADVPYVPPPKPVIGWTSTPAARLAISGVAVAAVGISSWLTTTDRSSAATALGAAAIFTAMLGLWAGVWAVASRAIVHRFNFLGHFAVAAAVALVGLLFTTGEEWLNFLFPDAVAIDVLSVIVIVALFCALIAGHLALSSSMSRERRWRAGILIAGTAGIIGGFMSLVGDDSFTDVPTFSGVLKPIAPSLIPTSSVGEFGEAMAELKKEVDEEIAKKKK
jgi:hypothetical protein